LYNSSIELSNERTRPTIKVTVQAEQILAGRKVHISISHLSDYAPAIVVNEDESRNGQDLAGEMPRLEGTDSRRCQRSGENLDIPTRESTIPIDDRGCPL
jgi:hypothetical protein